MKKLYARPLINLLFLALAAAVFFFLGREFSANWEQIRKFEFDIRVWPLILASLLYITTFIIFSFGWHIILRHFHHHIPLGKTILYFFITQPAKYIPGKIWIGVTRMKFCNPHGVPNSVTLLTTGIEAILEIMAGAYISVFAILQLEGLGRFSLVGAFVLIAIGLLLLIPKIFYFLVNIYLRIVRLPIIPKENQTPFTKLILLQGIYLLGLAGMGLSQAFFLAALVPVESSQFPFLVSIGAFSYIASILAIFTPGGLGVREGVWYLGLQSLVTPSVALVYAFVSRIWTVVIETFLLALSLPVLWIYGKINRK